MTDRRRRRRRRRHDHQSRIIVARQGRLQRALLTQQRGALVAGCQISIGDGATVDLNFVNGRPLRLLGKLKPCNMRLARQDRGGARTDLTRAGQCGARKDGKTVGPVQQRAITAVSPSSATDQSSAHARSAAGVMQTVALGATIFFRTANAWCVRKRGWVPK